MAPGFGWIDSAIKLASKVANRVKALVSVKEQVILVSVDLHSARVPFAKAHEMGHTVLPWHEAVFYACDEGDLSADSRAQLEDEANAFGSELLVPQPLLEPFYKSFPTSFETVMMIQKKSGAAIEMTAYQYVRHHPGVCCVLTLDELEGDALLDMRPEARLQLVRKSLSAAAVNSPLGGLVKGQTREVGKQALHRVREEQHFQVSSRCSPRSSSGESCRPTRGALLHHPVEVSAPRAQTRPTAALSSNIPA